MLGLHNDIGLGKKLLGFDVDTDEAEETGPKGRKSHGPVRYRHITNGQARRARERFVATRRRKVGCESRRRYFQRQQSLATLRGHLQAVGELPYVHGGSARPGDEASARDILERNFGSVDEALKVYKAAA